MSENNEIVDKLEDMEINELRALIKAIKDIIEDRETPTDVSIGDGVEFELRDGFTVSGTVVDMTKKRAKVKVNSAKGNYTIDLKKVKVTFSAPTTQEGAECSDVYSESQSRELTNESESSADVEDFVREFYAE